jgi:hypothetical protein
MVKGITYILTNDVTFRAAVGLNAAGSKYKAYPVMCPSPESAPYSVVIQTGKTPIECKGGAPTAFNYSYDVYSFDPNYDNAVSINAAVVAALSKPDGGSYNGVEFSEIRFVNEREAFDKDYRLFGKISSFEAWVDES